MSEILSKLITRMVRSVRGQPTRTDQPTMPATLEAAQLNAAPGISSGRLNNREISDLQFIERVMEEAINANHPLFERVRYLAIAADVLDQFYAVRVAKLRRSVARRDGFITPDGLTPSQQLTLVMQRATATMEAQQALFVRLGTELEDQGIFLRSLNELSDSDRQWLQQYFLRHCVHVLTPLTLDEEHPMPFIPSGGLCAVLELRDGYILLPLPAKLPRFIAMPGDGHRYVTLDTLIRLCWQDIVPDADLESFGVFQVLRDNDLARKEMDDDLRAIVESGLRERNKANVIRLNVADTMSEAAIRYVALQLGLLTRREIRLMEVRAEPISTSEFIAVAPFVGLANFSDVLQLSDNFPQLLFPPYQPRYPAQLTRFGNDCFAALQAGDLAVHWPFESFDSVERFIEQAATDQDVIAIKQTLYRTSDESPIVESLITAAKTGKTVLAVVELEARDNEQSNVALAKRMEAAGVQVVYGIVGLKIHCKATLVVRMEDNEAITYTHLGTGNYHPKNARIYTDVSFFTRDQDIGHDTHLVFNYLTSEKVHQMRSLLVAPHFLRTRLVELIDREIVNAASGLPAHICIKVNGLTDPAMIEKLYEASEAGVEIDLVVRRHCALRAGVPGMSSRIRVKSIVGRFLEHSRIYLFANGADIHTRTADVFFGSADLMERNLDERTEILVPVRDPSVRALLVDGIMHANVKDTRQSWLLTADNEYDRVQADEHFDAQTFFMTSINPQDLGPFPGPMSASPASPPRGLATADD